MMKKVKVALVCAMVSMGLYSCSSDDNSSSGDAYEIVAKTSDNALINNIVVVEDGATETIAELGKKNGQNRFQGRK
ncbi:hypothetical protein QNH98_06285 [Myroides sp. mNGS23_01]|nr:hypothetical protein [Myroides sp. mNGS23_01]WHT40219.1 hypothetical protein QNH98_06285 [Myroides sp. mNGS23_01]